MRLIIQTLRQSEEVRTALSRSGWRVQEARPDSLRAVHPEVMDQKGARQRLQDIGLLTSARCRIEFES